MPTNTDEPRPARFIAVEIDVPGRRFYVKDGHSGRTVGRAWGRMHLAQAEADRRNAKYVAVHGR